MRVLVYGHFRSVHLGHYRLFEYARSLGDSLVVAINLENKSEADIRFSESLIRSFPFSVDILRYTELEELVQEVRPDIVVRGQEFKDFKDSDNDLFKRLGIRLMFGSGNTHLSEENLSEQKHANFSIRDSFREYSRLKGIDSSFLEITLRKFEGKKVTVIGDLVIDEYVSCQAIGMSQEDPVVVSTPVGSTRYVGGAGIVAAHCQALGAKVNLVSLVGDDEGAHWAADKLNKLGISSFLLRDSSRPTVVKQRFKNSNQTLFRLTHFRAEEAETRLLKELANSSIGLLDESDILIFSDFSYGTLHQNVVETIKSVVKADSGVLTAADSQSSSQIGSLSKFKGVDLVTPTEHEARIELRNDVDGIAFITQQLAKSLDIGSVILKLGADGVLLGGFKDGREVLSTDRIPAVNQNPIDVSGAGDSLLAVSALALSAGCDLQIAAYLGSVAAGIQVSRKGNVPMQIPEVRQVIQRIANY